MNLDLAIQQVRVQDKTLKRSRNDADKLDMIMNSDNRVMIDKLGNPRPLVKRRFLAKVRRYVLTTEPGFFARTWDSIVTWITNNMDVIIRIAVQLLSLLLLL